MPRPWIPSRAGKLISFVAQAGVAFVVAAVGLCSLAVAAPLSYNANINGKDSNATVDAFQSDNQPYVSLSKLLKQLGGTTRETPGKLTMDLGGHSAVVSLNGTMVSTSSASFSLHFPVKEADGGPYVAVEDLERLAKENQVTVDYYIAEFT